MQFEAPITVAEAIAQLEAQEYVIPALQRGFIWQPVQVERLLDSLMRDYPIGSFLFWKVSPSMVKSYPFFQFCSDVVRHDFNPAPVKHFPPQPIAVLDGQQRLTAFAIATGGSYSWRGRGRAGIRKHLLYLDLLACDDDAGEEELCYRFKFLSPEEAAAANPDENQWFLVRDAFKLSKPAAIFKAIQTRHLADHPTAFETLDLLHRSLTQKPVINYYLEKSDDLGKVLNIFVRLNRAGTTLSYPDLLLSAATLKWKRDARCEFAEAVRSVNQHGFSFTKDRVLKSAMVLANMDNIKFKAASFTPDQTLKVEDQWPLIKRCLPIAAHLLSSFGLDQGNLTAENVIIPIAYYVKARGLKDSYVLTNANYEDRERIRSFVIRSLLKGSFWTGAVDSILIDIRKILQQPNLKAFPIEDIERAMARLKKPLTFSSNEIEILLDTGYGRRSTTLVLSLLYPGVDLTEAYHQDHVFPRGLLTEPRLVRAGLNSNDVATILRQRDQLSNLQLLRGELNIEKSHKLPSDYVATIRPASKRQDYLSSHDLEVLPSDVTGVLAFFAKRRAIMSKRLRSLVAG
jgi:hypothetical protein